MFKRYRSKPFGLVKKTRNRASRRVSSLPEEESLIHKASGSIGVRVEPIITDTTSDPGIKECQEYYKISQYLSRLESQVEKIREKANIFRNAGILNNNTNNREDKEACSEIIVQS